MKYLLFIAFVFLPADVNAGIMPDLKGDVAGLAHAVAGVDKGCLQLKQNGPCMIGDIPGVWISYYEPTLVIRTIGNKAGLNTSSGGNLQFHEVHIYDFPLKGLEQMALCGSLTNTMVGLRFLSELDQPLWRKETSPPSEFIGSWGPLSPRTGFVNHYSPAIASALTALRGISAAGALSGHRAEAPILYGVNQWQDKVQMVEPEVQMCMKPGADPRMWLGKISNGEHVDKEGKYLWIYWKFTECCKTAVSIPTSL